MFIQYNLTYSFFYFSQWGRDLFDGLFRGPAENVNMYLTQPNFIESTLKQSGNQKEVIESVHSFLVDSRPMNFDQCVAWARLKFEDLFVNQIKQLLFNFPADAVSWLLLSWGIILWCFSLIWGVIPIFPRFLYTKSVNVKGYFIWYTFLDWA